MLEIARHLYRLSCLYETGTLYVNTSPEPWWVLLRYGYVCAMFVGADTRLANEARLKALLQAGVSSVFTNDYPVVKGPPLFPFHPATLIREYVENQHQDSSVFRGKRMPAKIQLLLAPHSSCMSVEERSLVPYLTMPHTFEEILRHASMSNPKLRRFLTFLEQMETLSIQEDSSAALQEEYALLGLVPPVTREQVKTAYRGLMRKFHPDANPQVSAKEFQTLTEQVILIKRAYQRLRKVLKSS